MNSNKNINEQSSGVCRSNFRLGDFCRDERGLSTVEYIILMVVVVVGAVGTWNSIGGKVKAELKESKTHIEKLKGK